ncbi:MAG: GNAT family N-acetyltransferase [Planctomycetes bacterium]|nr:GNAT family N-acetyltransferase [Planctomycetota bacterium]
MTNIAASAVRLREVAASDLPIFFEHESDPAASHMAAFTREDPGDREAFTAHWNRILKNDSIIKRTVTVDGHVAGSVMCFELFGQPAVSYWIGKEYWGRGVGTQALSQFLECVTVRPLYARAARDNVASLRVLEKCGFAIVGYDQGFANARGQEIEEVVLQLS